MTIFENKNDKRLLPFIDYDKVSLSAIIGMIVFPTLAILLTIYLSEDPKILSEFVGRSEVSLWMVLIMPFVISVLAVYLLSGRNLKQYFQGNVFGYWRSFSFFFIANAVYAVVAAHLVPTNANGGMSGNYNFSLYVTSLVLNLFDLSVEEIFAIQIFIAVTVILKHYFKLSRSSSIYLGLIISAVLFGLMHFKSYNWNLAQMFIVIGASRFFLTGLYIRTKNVFLSFIVHYLTDGIILTIAFFISVIK